MTAASVAAVAVAGGAVLVDGVIPSWASMAARRLMTLSRTPPRGLSWLDIFEIGAWRREELVDLRS